MKNRKRLAILGLSAALCLSACGEAEESSRGLRGDAVTEETEEVQPTETEVTAPGSEEQPTEAQGPVGTSEEDGFFADHRLDPTGVFDFTGFVRVENQIGGEDIAGIILVTVA